MAVIGYARVSSKGQSLEIQLDKLKGCERIFRETCSGTTDNRPELKLCLDYIREGDILVVTKLDRLARNTLHLCNTVELLHKKGVSLKVLDQDIDTGSPTGRLLVNILAVIAQFETEIRAERQAEGIRKAKERGVRFGAQRRLSDAEITDLRRKRNDGFLIRQLMKEYNLSKVSVYRYLSDGYAGKAVEA